MNNEFFFKVTAKEYMFVLLDLHVIRITSSTFKCFPRLWISVNGNGRVPDIANIEFQSQYLTMK